MLILQALLLWAIVSALMTGGAMLFHRLFPAESPWLGFIVPPLALVAALNFLEHLVALPVLLYLLPVLLAGTLWMALAGKYYTRALVLPTGVFLAAFAFTFAVRCLQADISFTSDGVSDLNMINNFLQGQRLPPPDTWLPPFRFEWYYDLQHYAASVLVRLLGVKIGTGYNVAHALLSALICVAGAGAAHRLSGGRLLVTLAVPFLIEAAATGSAAYLILFCHNNDYSLAVDLSGGMTLPHPDNNPVWNSSLWPWLQWDPRPAIAHLKEPATLRLQVPGFWTWRDEYHANASGHFLTILALFAVAELAHAQRTLWPWVLAAIIPLLAAMASAWALPITVLLCWVMLPVAWFLGRRPAPLPLMLWILAGSLVLLWPGFYDVTTNPEVPAIQAINPLDRAPLLEFLLQWWPILALWIAAAACFRSLSFAVRWFLAVIPLMLLGIELITIESRYNTIEKMWGYTWAVGLVGLFPVVASRPGIPFRIVTLVLLASGFINLAGLLYGVYQWPANPFHLEGSRYLTNDAQKGRLLQIVGQTRGATYLAGKCEYCYNETPALTAFTGNRSYSAWHWFESRTNYEAEAQSRAKLNNDFFSGAMTDRLRFLQANRIDGVIIWPDDDISDDALAALRRDLDPAYDYIDAKGTGAKNAGVFLKR
ncbi:MAG: DUF2298 domain-containing protein [Verrucomicrobiota bacterium]